MGPTIVAEAGSMYSGHAPPRSEFGVHSDVVDLDDEVGPADSWEVRMPAGLLLPPIKVSKAVLQTEFV